jgi:hypothetical protein
MKSLERERKNKTNRSMAQGGGKPTFVVPKGLRREKEK